MNPPPTSFRQCGHNVLIHDYARILAPENITLGSDIIIDDFVFIGRHKRLVIGNHVHIACTASITGGGEVLICDFCGISSGARLLSGTDDFTDGALTNSTIPPEFRDVRREKIVLYPHVTIGQNAVILPNIVIGEGASVGAGAVVTRDLEPWGIYVGAPARKINTRPQSVLLANEKRFFEKYGYPSVQYRSEACLKDADPG